VQLKKPRQQPNFLHFFKNQHFFNFVRKHGLDYGNTHVGLFTLGNGATAYVATTNSTCLIIQVTYGDYLIVGGQDTQALANSFSQNIYPVTFL